MIPRKVRISPPTNRQPWHSKTQHSQSIVLEEPVISSLAGMERHKIRPVSTRISPYWRERFITPMRTKAGESAPHFSDRKVLPFEWSTENNQGRYHADDTGLRIAGDHDCEYTAGDKVEGNHVQQP